MKINKAFILAFSMIVFSTIPLKAHEDPLISPSSRTASSTTNWWATPVTLASWALNFCSRQASLSCFSFAISLARFFWCFLFHRLMIRKLEIWRYYFRTQIVNKKYLSLGWFSGTLLYNKVLKITKTSSPRFASLKHVVVVVVV